VLLTANGARLLRPENVNPELAEPYRSPEQVRGSNADARSDIFSYGSILYELVSGRRPFPGRGLEMDEAIIHRPAAALNAKTPVYAAMEGVIAGCLQKDPAGRRQRIQNAVTELKLAGRPALRTSPTPVRTTAQVAAGQSAGSKAFTDPIRPVFRPQPGRVRTGRTATVVLAIMALLVLYIAVRATLYFVHPQSSSQVLSFRVTPPQPAGYCGTPSVSPEGRYVA
jgi:serine/threonine protein kinase